MRQAGPRVGHAQGGSDRSVWAPDEDEAATVRPKAKAQHRRARVDGRR